MADHVDRAHRAVEFGGDLGDRAALQKPHLHDLTIVVRKRRHACSKNPQGLIFSDHLACRAITGAQSIPQIDIGRLVGGNRRGVHLAAGVAALGVQGPVLVDQLAVEDRKQPAQERVGPAVFERVDGPKGLHIDLLQDVLGVEAGAQGRVHLPHEPGPQPRMVQYEEPPHGIFVAADGLANQELRTFHLVQPTPVGPPARVEFRRLFLPGPS